MVNRQKNKRKASSSSQEVQQDQIPVQLLMSSYFRYLQETKERKKELASQVASVRETC